MSAPPDNRPLEAGQLPNLAETSRIASSARSGRVLLVLTFSGGGTRAAAFSYGALTELAQMQVRIDEAPRRLLDEIDLVSTVSGGSFTGAYFGLHGDAIFESYEDVFLRKNVQLGLFWEPLRPRNWLGLLRVDRSQLAARYYDRKIFHGATFADMGRPGSPEVIVNATDLSTASRFPFSPLVFALICSDLDSYPVADAVTASSAVPIIFPTVRLRNFAGQCGFEPPAWARDDEAHAARPLLTLIRKQIADQSRSIEGRDYIHLLDGGVSDNLGLANGLAAMAMFDDHVQAFDHVGHPDIELILVVTVNAEPKTQRPWDGIDRPPSAPQIVSGLSGAEIATRNKLYIDLARAGFSEMAAELSTPEKPVRFEMVEVSFARVADPGERDYLRRIETSFNLSDEKVDRLIAAARQVLRDSPELARAIDWLERNEPNAR